jgi:predicted RNA-binding Zn ribbon-like protein
MVQAFLNTVDLEDGSEEFATSESLAAWIAERVPVAGASFTEDDRLRAMSMREALRDFVQGDVSGDAARTLQQALDAIPFTLCIDGEDGPHLEATNTGIDAFLARIVADVYRAMIDGTWERLKICRNDVCRWAFYDASKNHSGVWCSMSTCGSKAKARAYRTRAKSKETR